MLQARDMDRWLGSWEIPSEQMVALNGVLILLLSPLMDYVLYPLLAKKNILVKLGGGSRDWITPPPRPTHRICAGMALCTVSMAIAGGLDLVITSSQENSVSVAWQVFTNNASAP